LAKLIWAVIQEGDADAALAALRAHKIGVTQMSTSGGFMRKGNVTLIIGVDEARMDEAITILRESCQTHVKVDGLPPLRPAAGDDLAAGAAVFVLDLCNDQYLPVGDAGGKT